MSSNVIGTLASLPLLAAGCAKVSDFSEPYMNEVFMGGLSVTPAIKGFESSAYGAGVVVVIGNQSGRTVTLYGIPKEQFALLPQKDPWEPPPSIGGMEADVVDKKTLKIKHFASLNQQAEDLELEVTGTLNRKGARLSTTPDDPIVISGKAGHIKDYIPEEMRNRFRRHSDGATMDRIEDDERLPMYQITFDGQVTTIF